MFKKRMNRGANLLSRRGRVGAEGVVGLELLEGRQLLAAISWDGGAGDNLWHSAANWSGDVVPNASDDVTIDVAAEPTIQLTGASGNRAVNSLTLREHLTISGGSTLTIGTTASLDGDSLLTLNNGRLSGGEWTVVDGDLRVDSSPGNALSQLFWNGSIGLMSSGNRLSFSGNVTVFNGQIAVVGANAEIGMANGTVLDAQITFPGTNTGRRIGPTASNATYTLAGGVGGGGYSVGGTYGGSAWGGTTVIVTGSIEAITAGQTVTVNPQTLTVTTNGVLNVFQGNLNITPSGTWTTAGTTIRAGGTLTLGGTWDTSGGIGIWVDQGLGGSVNITGTVQNTGGTIELTNGGTGSWTLTGGHITGGTLLPFGGNLLFDNNPANRLSNIVIGGDLELADSGDRLSLGLGVTLGGRLIMSGANTELGMVNGATINSEVVFPGSVAGRRIGPTTGSTTYTFGANANLHGGAFTLGGTYGGSAWGGATIVNQGVISSEIAGQTITISPANFSSTGVLNVGPGNISISPTNAWSTAGGTINVSGGVLTMNGTYTTGSGIGTWNRTGGVVQVTGAIDNAGGTLTLNAATGSWELNGGSVTGGTVIFGAGSRLNVNSDPANRLTSVIIQGNIELPDSGDRLSIGIGVTINGVIIMSGANTELGLVNGSVLDSQVMFSGPATGRRIGTTSGNATYTFGPNAHIHGGPFTIGGTYGGSGWGGSTVINRGRIVSTQSGQAVTIAPGVFTNESNGSVQAGAGNLLISPNSTWTNLGTIIVNNATLTMQGTFVTAGGIGTWNRTAGSVIVAGVIDNSGATLSLNAQTGAWDLADGQITGGIVNLLAGGGLGMNSAPSNRLSNLTLNGNITLADANDRLSFGQTVTINGVITVSGAGAELGMTSGGVLNSEIVFPGTATGRRIGATAGNITYTLGPSANVHGGPFTIGGTYGGSGWGGVTVVNQGMISAEVAGQTVVVAPAIFTNAGTLSAGPGNLTINPTQTWSTSAGTVVINNVTFSIDGTLVTAAGIGTWNRTGGAVNVPGVIDNTGGTVILNAGTGEWTLTGGTITGGVVTIAAGGGLGVNSAPANRLNNVTVNGNINLPDANDRLSFGQNVAVNGVITVSGAGAELGLAPDAVLSAEVAFPGNAANRRIGATAGNSTFTFGPGANIHGGAFTIGGTYGGSGWGGISVINQGTIRAETAGQTVIINPVNFTSSGTIRAGAGNVTIAPTSGVTTNSGTISIAPASLVNVTGAYTQTAKGELAIEIRGEGATDTGRLVVSGTATLDGELTVALVNGFEPDCMNVAFLDATVVQGQFAVRNLPPPPDDHQSLAVYFGNQVRFAMSPPSDYNQDGVLNSQDLFDFLTAFFDDNADFNGDGATNSQDFFDFLSDFFEGC